MYICFGSIDEMEVSSRSIISSRLCNSLSHTWMCNFCYFCMLFDLVYLDRLILSWRSQQVVVIALYTFFSSSFLSPFLSCISQQHALNAKSTESSLLFFRTSIHIKQDCNSNNNKNCELLTQCSTDKFSSVFEICVICDNAIYSDPIFVVDNNFHWKCYNRINW